ncbi:hypothetical protein MXM08_07140 [Aeromonas sanarellii]|uniref:hypothetical protein n=1 Tax=Aeromonas sanarellii TaxID=633415 RepID=UPI002DB8185D|nr:hypothetical protein [Aeromonas sanarellii]MEB6606340.1 hypothetical protein [Aeromonas sanarellii]
MKAIRIILQLVILAAGGITIAALIVVPDPDFTVIVVLLGCVALLLALTLILKEHTETRLSPDHKLSLKPIGMVLFLSGIFAIFYGASILIGQQLLPNGSGTCRALCGIILLVSEAFGQAVAKLFAFGLWSVVGLFLCFIGYHLVRGGR